MSKNQKRNDGAATGEDPKKMFEIVTKLWESTYGHGWKRRLAELADVPESTVHSWLKAKRLPPWLERILKLLAENSRLKRNIKVFTSHVDDCAEAGQVVETDRGFAVYRFTGGVGKLVCDNISNEDTATEIASLPRLKNIVHRLQGFLARINETPEFYSDDDAAEAEELILELSDWARPAVLKGDAATLSEQDLVAALGEALKTAKK